VVVVPPVVGAELVVAASVPVPPPVVPLLPPVPVVCGSLG
ncbi:hypothetical protein AAULR_05888, partial [Lacticaseibacillus rhamnosus MTCC 5462]